MSAYQVMSLTNRPGQDPEADRSLSDAQRRELVEFLSQEGAALMPIVGLIERAELGVDHLVDQLGTAAIEAVLELSAQGVAGPRHPGRAAGPPGSGGDIRWHGRQQGQVCLGERKLKVTKPRLRRKAAASPDRSQDGGAGAEVKIPAYPILQTPGKLSQRMWEILMLGVSTRRYQKVLPKMAQAVGLSKSAVSRQAKHAAAKALEELAERRFDAVDILLIYLDGLRFAGHHILAAVGVDQGGTKHVLGLRQGASENATVVGERLEDLVARGVKPGRRRLFVIDGAKALRAGIDAVYGSDNPGQRCRNHKLRNVLDHLPLDQHDQTRSAIRAAWKLDAEEGQKKLEQLATWLGREHPSAAASLREGLSEMFTINRLGLPASLRRGLGTTNLIDSSHAGVREKTDRVTNWQDGAMVLRWAASAFRATEQQFRKILGYQQLWMLEAHLKDSAAPEQVGQKRKAG